MYVVRRSFRDVTGMIPAGSVIEPAGIKRFKRALTEGHIVVVTGQNYNEYSLFFKERFGVTIPLPCNEKAPAENKQKITEERKVSPVAKPTAKPVTKSVASKA